MSLIISLNISRPNFLGRPFILSQNINGKLFAKKVEVVVDGMCDVLALLLFQKQSADGAQGQE
jgi:glutathione S-transferase